MKLRRLAAASAAATLCLFAAQAGAATKKYSGSLTPDNEVTPPVGIDALDPSGEIEVVYDDATKRLCGLFRWRDLTGPPTAFHIHLGNAGEKGNGKIILPVPAGLTNDSEDTQEKSYRFNIPLDQVYETALPVEGLYGNVHTAKNVDGEIRDQLFEYDGFDTPECPPPTVLDGADAGASDGGSTSSSSSSSSSSGGATTDDPAPASDTPSTTSRSKDAGAAPAKEEGGCSTVQGSADASWMIGLAAVGAAFAMRARRRKRTRR